jgi:hypothetical protein
MLADLERTLRRHKLERAAAALKDTVLPALPDSIIWETLSFCPLRDTAQAAGVSRCWRRVAEARLLQALRTCRAMLRTRWIPTEFGWSPEPTKHLRADVDVQFDFESGVGPVADVRADLVCHEFVDNLCGDREVMYEPSVPWTVRKRYGFRVAQRTGADGVPVMKNRDRDEPSESDAHHAKRRRTRFVARVPLSEQCDDGALRLTLKPAGAPFVLNDHPRTKYRRNSIDRIDFDLLPSHARVGVGGEWALDAFGDDDAQAWRPLSCLLEDLAPPILQRSSVSVRGSWRYATDPRPSPQLPGVRALRLTMALERTREIEDKLTAAGLCWKTVEQLRSIDFFCKDVLRVEKPGYDFVAKQLGFVGNRHCYQLAPDLLVDTLRHCEHRFDRMCGLMKRHLTPWPVDHWGLTAALKELTACKIQREILTSLVWAARFGCADDPLSAPPRPENAGVYAHLDEGANSELLRPLTGEQKDRYLRDLRSATGSEIQCGPHGYVTRSAY